MNTFISQIYLISKTHDRQFQPEVVCVGGGVGGLAGMEGEASLQTQIKGEHSGNEAQ